MWKVIYVAPSANAAERLHESLLKEGFLVQIRAVRGSKQQYELLVPQGELDDVQEILNNLLHGGS